MAEAKSPNTAPLVRFVFESQGKEEVLELLFGLIRDYSIQCAYDGDAGDHVAGRLLVLFELHSAIRQM